MHGAEWPIWGLATLMKRKSLFNFRLSGWVLRLGFVKDKNFTSSGMREKQCYQQLAQANKVLIYFAHKFILGVL